MSKHVKDKISLYIDGLLKEADLKAFEAHVKTCGECANALAGTKRAIAAAKKTKEEPLPVNFYVKLNHKLDAVEAKKDTKSWVIFMRGAVAVFTMLIVGVFIYNLKNQTNNFSSMTMKQDQQMPKEKPEAEVQSNALPPKTPGVAPKPAMMALKKKAMAAPAPAEPVEKDKVALSVDAKKIADDFGYSEKQASSVQKEEKMKTLEAKPAMQVSRAFKAPAAAAKMQGASVSSAGMAKGGAIVNEPEVSTASAPAADTAAAPMEEEAAVGGAAMPEDWNQTFVFKDEKAWNAFASNYGIIEPGKMDWTKQMIVSILCPRKPSSDYWVEITGVEYLADRIIISYRERKGDMGSIYASKTKDPHGEQILKKSDLPVEFKEVK